MHILGSAEPTLSNVIMEMFLLHCANMAFPIIFNLNLKSLDRLQAMISGADRRNFHTDLNTQP
jgi:hypothetical protein